MVHINLNVSTFIVPGNQYSPAVPLFLLLFFWRMLILKHVMLRKITGGICKNVPFSTESKGGNSDDNEQDDDDDDDDDCDGNYLHPSLFAPKKSSRLEEIIKVMKVSSKGCTTALILCFFSSPCTHKLKTSFKSTLCGRIELPSPLPPPSSAQST